MITLTGTGTTKEKREALERLQNIPDSAPLVIVATGKYVGEGFDYPRLDTLFLVLPISWKGLLAQYAGRLHRENEGKRDVRIYDYIDIHEPVCDSMYRKRLKGYASIGYKTIEKGSPTLFDNIEGIDLSTRDGLIFDGKSFFLSFCKDVKRAKHSIAISSPRLYKTERNAIVNLLRERMADGVDVMVVTSSENEQTMYLRSQGMQVRCTRDVSVSTAIIDKSVVWYGSINILGYASEEDNAIRVTDNFLADDMLKILNPTE